jgi:hypothetical protein
MSDIKTLTDRIEGAVAAFRDKAKKQEQAILDDYLDRQKRLAEYEKVQTKVVEIAKPRLEALAARAKEWVKVTPSVSQFRRAATFEFNSPKAKISLTFSVAPDQTVNNVVTDCDLRIIPVLWKFESHSELSTPVANFDAARVTKWLDDQIVAFVQLFVEIHESELYERGDSVEDPVAKIKFPKFAAGATLEHGGKTLYFIDDRTKQEYMKQQGVKAG